MISSIQIKNFKPHKDTKLILGNITFLCGQNGVGKSSIIQTLLLLRQSFQKNRLDKGLSLNKPLCYIGEGKDAIYQFADSDKICFEININDTLIEWIFDTKRQLASDFINIVNQNYKVRDFLSKQSLDISLFNKDFQYISAGRLADYESDDYAVDNEKQLSIEEGKAELTAHFLYKYQKEQVSENLLHPDTVDGNADLLYQTILWEREISKGVNIHPLKVGTSYQIRYSFDTDASPSGKTNEFTAKNVGFGLSYALPIIVAALSAKKDALILIENPEAHLHGYGQAKLTELMCLVAQTGVQIVVETHADNVINGALVATKLGKITKENIKIWSFEREQEQHYAQATEVEVLENGRIVYPPETFFDQIAKDRKILMGF